MPFLTLREVVLWFGITTFELFLQLLSLIFFTVLLTLKTEGILVSSWWVTFCPLFAGCGIQLYFTFIVFVRAYHEETALKVALARAMVVCVNVTLLLVFELLLCTVISGSHSSYSVVFTPLFMLMGLLMINACRMPNNDYTS